MGQPVTPNDRERAQLGQRARRKAGEWGSGGWRGEALGTGGLSKAVPTEKGWERGGNPAGGAQQQERSQRHRPVAPRRGSPCRQLQ